LRFFWIVGKAIGEISDCRAATGVDQNGFGMFRIEILFSSCFFEPRRRCVGATGLN
jgi:hypothetical protein